MQSKRTVYADGLHGKWPMRSDADDAVFCRTVVLVIRKTLLHDLSVWAIHRTIQINSRLTEIIIYFWKQIGDLRG